MTLNYGINLAVLRCSDEHVNTGYLGTGGDMVWTSEWGEHGETPPKCSQRLLVGLESRPRSIGGALSGYYTIKLDERNACCAIKSQKKSISFSQPPLIETSHLVTQKSLTMEAIRGSVIDGRVENVRYRQNQLQQLHAALRINADRVCDAISKHAYSSKTASEREFYLAMDSVNKAYGTLDFDHALKEEYLVKEGKDNLSRKVGLGLIAIRPGTHSRLYSIVTPLSMAIAAGNCVFLEVRTPNLMIDTFLQCHVD